MADNLQDFLRKAAERRQQQQGQSASPPPPIEAVSVQPHQEIYRGVEIIEDDPVPIETVSESVSAHVEQHLDTSDYSRRTQRLGKGVEQQDLGGHLQEVFDHRVGHISRESVADDAYENAEANEAAYSVADVDHFEQKVQSTAPKLDIAALMRSPESIRQAFIFGEILKPPTDRWED